MERRRSRRIITILYTRLRSNGRSYTGFIENLSENGIKWYQYTGVMENLYKYGVYIRNTPDEEVVNCNHRESLEVELQLPSGEKLNLLCRVKRFNIDKTQSHGLTNSISMEIIDPPLKYKEFFKTRL